MSANAMTEKMRVAAVALIVVAIQALFGCAHEKESTSGAKREDARITAAVQALINGHPDLGPPNLIQVRARNRIVYLSGFVNTDLAISNAEAVALQAPGVARVVSSIGVEQ